MTINNKIRIDGNTIVVEQQYNTFPTKKKFLTEIKNNIVECKNHKFDKNYNIKIITKNNCNLETNQIYHIDKVIDAEHFTFLNTNNLIDTNISIEVECNSVNKDGNVPPGITFIGRRGCVDDNSVVEYFSAKEGDYLGAIRWSGNLVEGSLSNNYYKTFMTDSSSAEFEVKASEDWTENATGTTFQMWATPVRTTKRTVISSHSPETTTFISNRFIFQNDKDEEYLSMDLDNNIKLTGKLHLPSSNIPSSFNSFGKKGQIVFDNNYVYICVNENEWKRSILNSW